MATLVYVQGLSGRGFRVKNQAGLWKTCKEGVTVQVDVDDPRTRLILSREKDNFIRVSASNSTTAQIIGTRRDKAVQVTPNGGGTQVSVVVGTSPTTIDLTDGKTRRTLKREKGGAWISSASKTSLAIRGLQEQQNGFDLSAPVSATATLSSDGTNPSVGDTVTVNDKTYRFESTMAQANDVKIGASSDATLDSLVKAVNQTGVVGTDYFTGTTAPTGVSAANRTGTGATAKVVFSATTGGTAGNAFASTETSTHLSFGATTFTGGAQLGNVVKVYKGVTVTIDPSQSFNFTRLRRHFKSWIEA